MILLFVTLITTQQTFAQVEAIAGMDETVCFDTYTLMGNDPIGFGSGTWTTMDGAIIDDPNSFSSTVSGLIPGMNTFTWETNDGTDYLSDDVIITYAPANAYAGPDQTIMEGEDLFLYADELQGMATGTWTIISGNGTFSDMNTPNPMVTGMTVGTHQFLWTVTEGICSNTSEVTIVVNQAQEGTSDAGADITTCSNTAVLEGNDPFDFQGTGTWTILSGSGVIDNPGLFNTTVSNLSEGVNTFQWETNDGIGGIFFDDVDVTFINPIAIAGPNQYLSSNELITETTLSANPLQSGQSGLWEYSGQGTPVFSDNTNPNTTVTNLEEGPGNFAWTVTEAGCSATDMLSINIVFLLSSAGADISSCSSTANMSATAPDFGIGEWSIVAGGGVIADIYDPQTTISDIPAGDNTYRWTIIDGNSSAFDDVLVSNLSPVIDAGADIFLSSDTEGVIISDGTLQATALSGPEIGTWSVLSAGGSTIIVTPNAEETAVSGLIHGDNVFQWSVTNDQACTSTDEVVITSGFTFVATPANGTTVNWNDAGDWDVNGTPSAGDSVVIANCDATINGDAECSQLVVGNGSTITIGDGTRAAFSFRSGSLVIEQSAERFPNSRGEANVVVTGNASLIVDASPTVRSTRAVQSGALRIGSGGSLVIEQSAERNTRAAASLRIGSGHSLVIEQSAERNPNNRAVANLVIGSGGSLVIEQSAERNMRGTSNEPNLKIGTGGTLEISSTGSVNPQGSLQMDANTSIVVESSDARAAAATLSLRGGSLVIEQSAERGTRGLNSANLNLGRGGSLVIEQSAERNSRGIASAVIPSINVTNGTIILGSSETNRAVAGQLSTRSLVIEQSAERNLSAESNFVMKGDGGLYIQPDALATGIPAKIQFGKGSTGSIAEGATIDLFEADQTRGNARLILEEGSSFINLNTALTVTAEKVYKMTAEQKRYVASPFTNAVTDMFVNNGTMNSWTESSVSWSPSNFSDEMSSMQGFSTTSSSNLPVTLEGELNNGTTTLQLTNDGSNDIDVQGWNLTGNPFASAIDLETVDFTGINNTVYYYDEIQKNYKLYQLGGVSTNGAIQYVQPGEAFFVKTESYETLSLDNSNRVHYYEGLSSGNANNFDKILKIKATANGYTDEAVIRFIDGTSDEYNSTDDAFKKFGYENTAPQIYTKTTAGLKMSVNALPFGFDSPVNVPFNFESGIAGTYTVSVTDLNFNPGITVTLVDNLTGGNQDLRANPTYTFDYDPSEITTRFEIQFGSGINSVKDVDASGISIYAESKNIFINTGDLTNLSTEIYNISGQLVHTEKLAKSGVNKIQLNLPSGIYMVKTTGNTSSKTEKVFISK